MKCYLCKSCFSPTYALLFTKVEWASVCSNNFCYLNRCAAHKMFHMLTTEQLQEQVQLGNTIVLRDIFMSSWPYNTVVFMFHLTRRALQIYAVHSADVWMWPYSYSA